jgi:hypothetical protein
MNQKLNIDRNVKNEKVPAIAFERVLPEINALRGADLLPIKLDIQGAVATALGSLPEILEHRTTARTLGTFDASCFDRLEDYALALTHAHGQYVTATQSADDLQLLADEAYATRERLHKDAKALAVREMVDAGGLKQYSGGKGYHNLAADLQIVTTVLRRAWNDIQGRCAVESGELERAEKLAMHMVRLVGLREQSPAMVAAVSEQRTRAYTLFINCYHQVRRAIGFIRWNEEDADTIAPSLFAGRKRKGADADPAEPQPVTPSPEPTVPGPGGGNPVVEVGGSPIRPLVAPRPGNNPFLQ